MNERNRRVKITGRSVNQRRIAFTRSYSLRLKLILISDNLAGESSFILTGRIPLYKRVTEVYNHVEES